MRELGQRVAALQNEALELGRSLTAMRQAATDATAPLQAAAADLVNLDNQRLLGLAGYGESRTLRDVPGPDERNRRIETRFLLSGQRENLADRIKRLDDLLADLRSLAGPKP